jgi:hypothetical protein
MLAEFINAEGKLRIMGRTNLVDQRGFLFTIVQVGRKRPLASVRPITVVGEPVGALRDFIVLG